MRCFLLFLLFVHYGFTQQACDSAGHNEFDFWLGTWRVHLADGTLAGYNTIVKEAGDCVLRESWKSARGNFTGSSLNFYQVHSRQWEQLWVDSSGSVLRLTGGWKKGDMVLISQAVPDEGGALTQNRITWTPLPDGRVRQLWELLADGKVKQVVFDGYYSKRE